MNNLVLSLSLLGLMLVAGCGYLDSGKEALGSGTDVLVKDRLSAAQKREALSEARRKVEISRKELDKCLEEYSQDAAKCEAEKKAYEADVKTYVDIQAR